MIWTEERKKLARAACQKWAGTPHRNRMAVAGRHGGIDCVNFVTEVMTDAGIIAPVRLPAYNESLGKLRERNVIEDILLAHLHATSETAPEFGDILIATCGRQSNHVGIVIDGMLWHVRGGTRCGYESLGDWTGRTQAFVRVHALGLRADPSVLTEHEIMTFAPAVETE